MIRSITVINQSKESMKMDLFRPELSGFIVKSVTGLGPVKATINVTDYTSTDGAIYSSSRISSRNIVLSLQFMPKETIEDTRHLSYRMFPVKKSVSLIVETDNRLASIDGYVESNEPDIFSKEEGAEISIICPDPFFKSIEPVHTTIFGGIVPLFEFSFLNESLTNPLLEMSKISDRPDTTINYQGDHDVGVTVRIRFRGKAKNIVVYKINTREFLKINTDTIAKLTGTELVNGDEIVVTTSVGKKNCVLIRNGLTVNAINCIDRQSSWFTLSKGENAFSCDAEYGLNNLEVVIENITLYEGV